MSKSSNACTIMGGVIAQKNKRRRQKSLNMSRGSDPHAHTHLNLRRLLRHYGTCWQSRRRRTWSRGRHWSLWPLRPLERCAESSLLVRPLGLLLFLWFWLLLRLRCRSFRCRRTARVCSWTGLLPNKFVDAPRVSLSKAEKLGFVESLLVLRLWQEPHAREIVADVV